MKRLVLALAVAALLAGCGGGEGTDTTDTVITTPPPLGTTKVSVYWLLEGKVWPVSREVDETQAVARAALGELFRGPTEQEEAELGLSNAILFSDDSAQVERLTVSGGVATYSPPFTLSDQQALAQVVYTLTQFPTVDVVEIDGNTYTRADFESFTPAILVESPRFFEEVENPVRATGTANTFEATFQYELTDTDGRIVDEGFVTATSGSGERGTFDFTTSEYEIPFDGVGALFVFELSAEDGSRTNLVEIPVRMSR
ncbi:MAG TPA: Gmad2 immunoglobulin-like domain-containing protein [Gaiellaceae bacterium]|nr:Gmad2 immunoglobulin-like domain-containing protein [Gaiellaceae bacterium]